MNKTRLYLYAAGAIAFAGTAIAAAAAEVQANPGAPTITAPTVSEAPAAPPYRAWTVGFEGGSQGLLGGFVSWRFSDHLGARFAGDYSKFFDNNYEIKGIHYDTKLTLQAEPLTLDIYPWQKSSFHFSAGVLFNQNELKGSANGAADIILDGQPLSGTLNLKIRQQPVAPYLSIGGNFFHFNRAHHWSMGGELGVAYAGEGKVSLTRTGPPGALIDAAVIHTQDIIKDYADEFRWWPVAKLYVSFSF